jgi:HAD superfamily hydrolase (TIGR01490 family)
MIAALFDSDGTLYTHQMGRGMILYARDHGRRPAARRYFLSVYGSYLLRKVNLIKPLRFQEKLVIGMAELLKGMSEQEGAAVFDWVANSWLLPSERADMAERLRKHQAQGHLVMIISGSFTPCLDRIGAHFGVENLIGTRLEQQDGHYTGRILPPVITAAAKAMSVRQFTAERGLEVDWPSSYAYGDSITDAPMLELAGHPVAVYPDANLKALARERDWEVLGLSAGR